jgi:hypothetical protein
MVETPEEIGKLGFERLVQNYADAPFRQPAASFDRRRRYGDGTIEAALIDPIGQ